MLSDFKRWLDTDPIKPIIAAQCATIAENYVKRISLEFADYLENNRGENLTKEELFEAFLEEKYKTD